MSNVIDEKIVEAKFDNKQFVAALTETIGALEKLSASLKLENAAQGINNLESAGKKFNLTNMMNQATTTITAFNNFGSSIITTFGMVGSKATSVGATILKAFGVPIPPILPKLDVGPIESGVSKSVSMLDRLRSALGLRGATGGIESVSNAMSKVDGSSMINAADKITQRFTAMGAMAAGVFATIGNQAVNAGERMLKAFSFDLLKGGFGEYETKIGSIQTIIANTSRYGTKLPEITKNLNELNTYADKTIYSFGDMTRNIGLFTNAGIRVGDATKMIQGFSNVAAASGTGAEQAAGAARQLSQALAVGTIRAQDWMSLTNAQMGNKNMQEGLVNIAKAMGKFTSATTTSDAANKDFKGSLEKGWLGADVMSSYLRIMAGDMDEAKMKSLGLSAANIKTFKQQQLDAENAATKVRTFTQLVGTLKEAVGSGWAGTFELLFGNFTQATTLFSGINKVLGTIVSNNANARNKMLKAWGDAGGKFAMIDAIKNSWAAFVTVVTTLKDAFREIFPKKTGVDLANMSKTFRDFTEHLKMGAETADRVKRTFAGIFAVFDIAKTVVIEVAKGIFSLFKAFSSSKDASGGMLEFSAKVGDFLVNLDKTLAKSGAIATFFQGLAKVLKVPVDLMRKAAEVIGKLFTGFDTGKAKNMEDSLQRINGRLSPLEAFGKRVSALLGKLGGSFHSIGELIGKASVKIGQAFSSAFSQQNFDKTLDLINAGLLGGILLLLKKFVNGGNLSVEIGGGLTKSIKGAMGAVTETMKNMQAQIKAQTILKIAEALALLTASIFVLSTIDSGKLTKALIGMGVGMAALQVSLVALTTAISIKDALKLPFISSAITKLSAALLIYAFALKVLASISLGDSLQAVVVLGGTLAAIAKTMKIMPKDMNQQASALLILSVALVAMATALKIFGSMSWDEIEHGLTALAGALIAVGGAMRLMPKGMVLQAAALLVLSVALNALAAALKIFNTMSWDAMEHGLVALAGALVIIAASMRLMPNGVNMLLQAAALNAVAVALGVLAGVLKIMGGFGWEEIGKGLITLGGAMLILALGLNAMNGAILGAGALLIASGALAILIPQLVILGNLSIGTIITALVTLAATFVILGVAGALLGPVVLVLMGLGVALVLIGAAVALVGVGVLAMATAFGIFVGAAMAGFAVVVQLINVFVQQIPNAMRAFGEGIVAVVKVLAAAQNEFTKLFMSIMNSILDTIIKSGPKVVKALVTMLNSLVDAIIKITPKIGQMFLVLIDTGLHVLEVAIPRIARAGLNIMLGLLNALSSRIGDIIRVTTDIIVKFINGIGIGLPRIVDAGVKMIINFVNGLAKAIDDHSTEMGEAGARLGIAMVTGMVKGIGGMAHVVIDKAKELAESLPGWVKKILGIHSPSKVFEQIGIYVNEGLIKGLTGNRDQVQSAFDHLKDVVRSAKDSAAKDITDYNAKIKKLNSELVADDKAIATQRKALRDAENREMTANANGKAKTAAQEKAFNESKAKAIQAAKDKLEKLTDARNKDVAAIAAAKTALAEARVEYSRSSDAYFGLTNAMGANVRQLQSLADQVDANKEKIKEANDQLDQAIKTRDDYKKSITDSFDALPDINKDTTLADYVAGMQAKTDNVTAFSTALQQLREYGLSDEMYQEFLKKGVDSLPFVQEVLKGGKESIDLINASAKGLSTAAEALGTMASQSLYQAGVDTAQGLLDGLKSQEAALEAEMARIAAIIAQKTKDELKIKSPSRVFIKMGVFVGQGLAQGLRDSRDVVGSATEDLSRHAVTTMQKTLMEMSNAVDGNMQLQPTITPVLDLSNVRKGATELAGMLPSQQINVDAAYSTAKDVSAAYKQNQQVEAPTSSTDETPAPISFTQNNYSPKALSAAEIYRQTTNQISTVKGALTKKNA